MPLAERFERVTATDASAEQIRAAVSHPRIDYRVAPAEVSGLDDGSIDLITVAQALHWFDIDRFFAEAQRVLAPRGVLAVWSYDLCGVEPGCDALIREVYDALDAYWPPERRLVEARYAGIEMPLPAIAVPDFEMLKRWSVDDLLGYLRTWSAYRRCLEETGVDQVAAVADRLRSAWGHGEREVRWPLAVRVCGR